MSVEAAKKLQPKDIGVSFGQAMTEEEFLEYRKKRIASGNPVKMWGPGS
jgi:hypothetical protein